MIKIYHVPNARSLRVIWLMEEMEEPYEVEQITFPLDDAYRKLSPTASVPTIVDGDIVMGESIAILQYLTGRRLQKSLELNITVGPNPDPAAYAEHLQFLHMGEASLMVPLVYLGLTRWRAPAGQQSNFTTELCEHQLSSRLAVVEARLADGRSWITGENFTIADISVGYAMGFARARKLDALLGPRAAAYLDRIQARPAYLRAAGVGPR
jgi:glutathione S-transferase